VLKKRAAKKTGAKKLGAKKIDAKPKKKVVRKPVASSDFEATFAGLKGVIAKFADELHVSVDEPRKYYLVTRSKSWRGGPMFFGAVMLGKAYVSYHLMPLYMNPALVKIVSPKLKKRMQGKACLNFREPDEVLFAELGELTKAGLEEYRMKGWL
jgi:hypothetical protein